MRLRMDEHHQDILVEFENNILVSQLATSSHIDTINRELIETVRFTFVEKTFFGNKSSVPLELDAIEDQKDTDGLYQSEQELLEDILTNKSIKHFRQLQYLATNHVSNILKLRYNFL